MAWCGYIPINRGDPTSHKEALAKAARWLQMGTPMFFFPEGTRSHDGTLKPFKVGAFKIADENGVSVVPIAIKGAKDLLPKGSAVPGKATLF